MVRCPRCSEAQHLPPGITEARCSRCAARWRWTVCSVCGQVGTGFEWDESWRCGVCQAANRSWWKTADADKEKALVAERRRADGASGLTPWLAGAAALVLVAVVGIALAVPRSSAADRQRTASAGACVRFTALKSAEADGTLSAGELRARADDVAGHATKGTPQVQRAARQLGSASADGSGTDAFLTALTAMTDACAVATGH